MEERWPRGLLGITGPFDWGTSIGEAAAQDIRLAVGRTGQSCNRVGTYRSVRPFDTSKQGYGDRQSG